MVTSEKIKELHLDTLDEYFMFILKLYVEDYHITARLLASHCSEEQKHQAKVFYMSCSAIRRSLSRNKIEAAFTIFINNV